MSNAERYARQVLRAGAGLKQLASDIRAGCYEADPDLEELAATVRSAGCRLRRYARQLCARAGRTTGEEVYDDV
jgi:hypothetical protein